MFSFVVSYFLLILAFQLFSSNTTVFGVSPEILENNYKLTDDVIPLNYRLFIKPHLQPEDDEVQFTFYCEVSINILIQRTVNKIVLHSKFLTYFEIKYWNIMQPDEIQDIWPYTEDPATDQLTLFLGRNLLPGSVYTLSFLYVGQMGDDHLGFYGSSYVDRGNNVRWFGVTHFKPNSARRAFPCFDEPKFKATFQLTLIVHQSFNSWSNTQLIASERLDHNTYFDTFEESPKMSPYAVSWLVCQLTGAHDGERLSVVVRKELSEQANYSAELGEKLLEKFNTYLAMPYDTLGIPKIEFAAIPDQSNNALEGWGFLTFEERLILYCEQSSTFLDQQNIALMISQKVAHMWFGILVTCEWWSFVWLQEGISVHLSYQMTNDIYPEWEVKKQFVIDELHTALLTDSYGNAPPLTGRTVASQEDLDNLYDDITYRKGSSIIRMFQHAMGQMHFRKALQNYLNEFQNEFVEPSDFVKHLIANWPEDTGIASQEIREMFDSFTTQPGYPVVTVNVSSDGMSMEISQTRFLIETEGKRLFYKIPFTYTTSEEMNFSSTKPKLFLEASDRVTKIDLKSSVDWVMANVQQTGYYRVNYDEGNWKKICATLMRRHWRIHVVNRAQIVDDLFNLARAGYIAYQFALSCLEYLAIEVKMLPWKVAFEGYTWLGQRLPIDKRMIFNNYIVRLSNYVFRRLGFAEKNTDTRLDIYNRETILHNACKYGNRECISTSLTLFEMMQSQPIPVNIRYAVYCTAMREGTEKHFNILFEEYKNKTFVNERSSILKSLGCLRNTTLVEKYFDIIVSDEMRQEDKRDALNYLSNSNTENVLYIFELIIKHLDNMFEIFGSYTKLSAYIYRLADLFNTPKHKELFELFQSYFGRMFGRESLNNSATIIEKNFRWDSLYVPDILKYLQKYS